jgi:hypothetical protein
MAVAEVWQRLLESAPGNAGDDGIQSCSSCCVVGGPLFLLIMSNVWQIGGNIRV